MVRRKEKVIERERKEVDGQLKRRGWKKMRK
jgi:hypothetical protein